VANAVYLELSNTIPSYCQQRQNYCGPAVAAMILEGYPPAQGQPVDHPESQGTLYSAIQGNNGEKLVPFWSANKGTDPAGMAVTLSEFGPPTQWVVEYQPDWHDVMYAVVHSVGQTQYPVAVLIFGFLHWIVVDGYVTDVDPLRSNRVLLLTVDSVDPLPECGNGIALGTRSRSDGWLWSAYYWHDAETGAGGSQWNRNFLGVIAESASVGSVSVVSQPDRGQVIRPDAAMQRAVAWLQSGAGDPLSAELLGLSALDATLVNADQYGYYIVSFGEERAVRGVVLVNAYNGSFLQVSVFGGTFQYLTQAEAWAVIAERFALEVGASFEEQPPPDVVAEMIFRPSAQTLSLAFPVWQFRSGHGVVRVTQQGRAFGEFTPSPGGF